MIARIAHPPCRRALGLMVALLLVLGISDCASAPAHQGAGRYVGDSAISTRVKTALAKQLGTDGVIDVQVETYKGTVQLSGFVDSGEMRDRAGAVAAGIPGVERVENRLALK